MIDITLVDHVKRKRLWMGRSGQQHQAPKNAFHHAAVFLKRGNVLSYGENTTKGYSGEYSTHAEEQALRNLLFSPTRRRRRNVKVDLLIIRTSRTGQLGISRPCGHCIRVLTLALPTKGYALRHVYYSTHDGALRRTTMDVLASEPPHLSQFYKHTLPPGPYRTR